MKIIFRVAITFIAALIVAFTLSIFINPRNISDVPTEENIKNHQKYDGIYSDLKFIHNSRVFNSFEGKFKNIAGRDFYGLMVYISFYDGDSKLEIKSDSIALLRSDEEWRFKIDFVDKSADSVRIDGFIESHNSNSEKLNVISEESYLSLKDNDKPVKKYTEEEIAAHNKEFERQHASNKLEAEKIASIIPNKIKKQLEAKYRGVRLRAESGGIDAMFELSEMLRNGIGCETNINESIQWLAKYKQKTNQK